jgi:hypothetical protein
MPFFSHYYIANTVFFLKCCVLCFSCTKEVYSIKLPGDPKLGEGKPENQNHAIIFTRGDALQTIDMNQVRTLSHDNLLILYIHLLCMIFCTFFYIKMVIVEFYSVLI